MFLLRNLDGKRGKMKGIFLDLTHRIDSSIPTWNGSCGFSSQIKMDYEQGCRVMKYSLHAGLGTHIDAPCHFFKEAKGASEIELENLIVPAVVLDVSQKVDEAFLLSVKDLEEFEEKWGKIPENSLFFLYTGWDRFWKDTERYRNCDSKGKMRYPGYSKEAALFLLKRNVVGIAIDTLSPDGTNVGFPVHEILLGSSKYILENVANLSKMPAKGAFAFIFPMKVFEGAEAPVRAVGFIPEGI